MPHPLKCAIQQMQWFGKHRDKPDEFLGPFVFRVELEKLLQEMNPRR